jgi:O-antigen ligase
MLSVPEKQERLFWITAIVAAGMIHISIAVSQFLLGAGLGMMLFLRLPFRFTRVARPLAIFFLLTLISLLLSPDPWGGHAQIRKFFVFLFIPLIYAPCAADFSRVRYLLLAWTAAASASGLWGLVQFYLKYRHAEQTGEDFYTAYVGARITGFESHWMTFGALQLSVLLFVLAHLLFSNRLFPRWIYASLAILGTAILLGWTRSIWLASVPSVLYLLWFWRPKMVWIAPVAAALLIAFGPAETRERITSLFLPHGDTDSNQHRVVTFRTGVEMIKHHPLFGLGPEQVGKQFNSYVPRDIPRPLPTGYYGHLHNIYVQYAAERGIPALIAVLTLIGVLLWDCFRALRALPHGRSEIRSVLHGTVAFTIAILVGGIFEFNLGDSEVLMMFTSVIGLAYAAIAQIQTAAIPATQSPALGTC